MKRGVEGGAMYKSQHVQVDVTLVTLNERHFFWPSSLSTC